MSEKENLEKNNLIPIEGSFGGGAKNQSDDEDTGYSTAVAYVTEILSEGIIEGLIPADKPKEAIFLDETPIRNKGSKKDNFKGAKIRLRKGFKNQAILPNVSSVERETSLNLEITKSTPVTREIISAELDAIRVRVGVVLQKFTDEGIEGDELSLKIEIKQGSEAFRTRKEVTIKGRYSQLTEFEWEFPVRNLGGTRSNFQVRVTKISEDSDDQTKLQRELSFRAYTEIIKVKLNYRFTAIVQAEFDAEQFNSIPQRAYRIGGIRVRIPSNATVRNDGSLQFTGLWDGSFYRPERACNDPVWQLFEILTNDRWGLRSYLDEGRIDKGSLYAASRYNNELIPDGLGGQEPRFQCSTVIQSKEKVYDVINALCSSCNMKPYWAEGTLFFWQDRPTEVSRQFTQADVENGDFVYSTTAKRSRFSLCYVTWNDPRDFYRQAVEVVEYKEYIAKEGVRETELTAYGCVSRGQAIRAGRWALFSSQKDTETVNFTSRAYGALVRPGDVISIADSRKYNLRFGGLLSEGNSTTQLRLDSSVEYNGGQISCTVNSAEIDIEGIANNGSIADTKTVYGVVETRNVTGYDAVNNIISVNPPFSSVPIPESNWIYQSPNLKPSLYRVLSVAPKAGDPTKVEITAIKYSPEKYALIGDIVVNDDMINSRKTFRGGQCDIRYSVYMVYFPVNGVWFAPADPTIHLTATPIYLTVPYWGAIRNPLVVPRLVDTVEGTQTFDIFLDSKGFAPTISSPIQPENQYNFIIGSQKTTIGAIVKAEIIDVTPLDGHGDDCGDVPAFYTPPPQPL